MSNFSFPLLSDQDLIPNLRSMGFPLTIAQLSKPTYEIVKPLFEEMIKELMGITRWAASSPLNKHVQSTLPVKMLDAVLLFCKAHIWQGRSRIVQVYILHVHIGTITPDYSTNVFWPYKLAVRSFHSQCSLLLMFWNSQSCMMSQFPSWSMQEASHVSWQQLVFETSPFRSTPSQTLQMYPSPFLCCVDPCQLKVTSAASITVISQLYVRHSFYLARLLLANAAFEKSACAHAFAFSINDVDDFRLHLWLADAVTGRAEGKACKTLIWLPQALGIPSGGGGLNLGFLQDICKPDPLRLRRHLSAVINFARYREDKMPDYISLNEETLLLTEEVAALEETNKSLVCFSSASFLHVLRADNDTCLSMLIYLTLTSLASPYFCGPMRPNL